jgi:hypothetical protein
MENATKTRYIDLTPEGCKTPEGNARVNAALEVWQGHQANMANESASFFREFGDGILRGERPDAETFADLREAIGDLRETAKNMATAQEEFLRAVAGR